MANGFPIDMANCLPYTMTCQERNARGITVQLKFNERLIAGTVETGIVYMIETDDCEARINGECICCDPAPWTCEKALRRAGIVLNPDPEPAPVASGPHRVKVVLSPQPERRVCPFYKAIRRYYAIIEQKGWERDDESVRAQLARLLGRDVPSRKTLNGNDWMLAGTLAKQARGVCA